MSDQFDVLRTTIVEAKLGRSQVSDTPWVSVCVTPDEPYMHQGVEVERLYAAVTNDLNWSTSIFRAELRHALGLEIIVLNKNVILGVPMLVVPIFWAVDLPSLVGKAVRVVVTEFPFEGMSRLRVRHFLPPQPPKG